MPLQKENVALSSFVAYVNHIKDKIDGLHKFRSILMPQEDDDQETLSYKTLFRHIGEVFIKFFSVNWIFSGKVLHKEAHLKFRFKMLRRIQSPELFTYLKKHGSKQKKNPILYH